MTRLGFFTRLLESGSTADRYRFALEQIEQAERLGFHSAWVAQHHFDRDEGGLPSPFVLLAAAASRTARIALGTGVVTLPTEDPVRVAEDASVLDVLSGGRLQLGVGSGGPVLEPFGRRRTDRAALFEENLDVLLDSLTGADIRGTGKRLQPSAVGLAGRLWRGTFSESGARAAGARGMGLMLSRTQPRPDPSGTLFDQQAPLVAAYRAALRPGAEFRVLASRTALVVDEQDRTLALRLAEVGLRRYAKTLVGPSAADLGLEELVRVTDTHVGTVDEVVASLSRERTLDLATDVTFQVHSVPATHELTLRSLELLATEVVPRLFSSSPLPGRTIPGTPTPNSP